MVERGRVDRLNDSDDAGPPPKRATVVARRGGDQSGMDPFQNREVARIVANLRNDEPMRITGTLPLGLCPELTALGSGQLWGSWMVAPALAMNFTNAVRGEIQSYKKIYITSRIEENIFKASLLRN